MKLTVGKQELLEKLSNVQNIVEKKNTMPVLSHFLLNVKKNQASMLATDLETAIREPISLSPDKDGRLCIPARKLFEIVRELDGDITLASEDSQWIRVSSGKSNFRLACLNPDDFPTWPPMEKAEEIQIDSGTLAEMIEKTIYSAGESDTRYTLNGLLFHLLPNTKSLTMVGTDGHRMALITRPIAQAVGEEKKIIVPRKAAAELRKFLDAKTDVSMLIGKNHILFKVGDIEFLARLIEGTYPSYSQVIPAANDKKLLIEREGFIKALRRVSVMSRDRSNPIKVDIEAGRVALSASNPDIGEATDEVAVEYSGDALSIGFSARYLLDALSSISGEKVVMELQDPLSPSLIREEDKDDYKCVVMPMRI